MRPPRFRVFFERAAPVLLTSVMVSLPIACTPARLLRRGRCLAAARVSGERDLNQRRLRSRIDGDAIDPAP
jgi:hypothetical protein